MILRHRLLATTVLGVACALPLSAQSARLPAAQMCDMSFRVLMLHVVDSAGVPVPDARLVVRRLRTKQVVPQAEVMTAGDYKVFEDGALPDLRASGEPFEVTLVKGRRTKRLRVQVGMDAARCHVRFITVPGAVVL